MGMDQREQQDGEHRVRERLILPLQRLGLGKPTGLTKDGFEAMQVEMCQKLARMSDLNLDALCEICAAHPGGKAGDRFPIGTEILKHAATLQPPEDDASPLMRAVFGHALGEEAIRDGWAPELLVHLRRHRAWPKNFVIGQLRDSAREAVRRLEAVQRAIMEGREITSEERAFHDRRRAALAKCESIAELGRQA